MLDCPNCHARLEDDAQFCDSCGTRIEPQPPVDETPAPSPEPAQIVYCSHCGRQTGTDSPFCPDCGASVQETMFCPECGQQVSSSSAVCPHCSFKLFDAVFCPNCGSPSNPEASFCTNCGASLKAEEQAAPSAKIPETGSVSKSKSKKGVVFAGIGAAVIAAVVLAVLFLGKNAGSSSNYAMYVKDKEIFYNGFSRNDPRQISSRLMDRDSDISDIINYNNIRNLCQFSKDGSLLFFPDRLDSDGYSLYYRRINKPKEEAVKIDSGLEREYYSVSDDAAFVTYAKNGNLYQYSVKKDDKQKIASDIVSYRVSDDGTAILYLNDENTLYYTVKGGDRDKIDSDVFDLCYVSDDLSVIFYIKDDSLYKKEADSDKEKISSDVRDVITAYDSGEVYYIKAEEEELTLFDFVDDDKKNEDAALTEPSYPNTSWNDPARDAKISAYESAMEEYSLKQQRDYLREVLKEQTLPQISYTLCYYDGKETSTLSESFADIYSVAYDAPVIAYLAYDQSEDISVKLSEIEDVYDVSDQITEVLYSTAEKYVAAGSVSAVLDEEEAQYLRLSADGRTLSYFDDIPEGADYGELYLVSVSSSGELGDPELYDSDVYAQWPVFYEDGSLLYFKDRKNGIGELYMNGEKIDYDVLNFEYDEDTGRLTYFTDWNEEKRYGTLKIYSGKDPEKIADDVYDYCAIPNGNILYLCDYSLKRYQGDLYLWNKKKAEKIDDSVNCILSVY